ncbi:homeobox-like protein [Acrasis kona]|uniref:CUP9 n=1 Tax=Acrasis kona TaxID=1008807 RepID=A0AAW2ZAG6_9EUKA
MPLPCFNETMLSEERIYLPPIQASSQHIRAIRLPSCRDLILNINHPTMSTQNLATSRMIGYNQASQVRSPPTAPIPTQSTTYTLSAHPTLTAGGEVKRRNNKSARVLPQEASTILNEWFTNHIEDPYPTKEQKDELLSQTGLSRKQLKDWFVNHRQRTVRAGKIAKVRKWTKSTPEELRLTCN